MFHIRMTVLHFWNKSLSIPYEVTLQMSTLSNVIHKTENPQHIRVADFLLQVLSLLRGVFHCGTVFFHSFFIILYAVVKINPLWQLK